MNKQQITSIITLILSQLGVKRSKINAYSEFSHDFGFNDSEYNLFLYYLELYFGISVKANEEEQLYSLNTAVNYVESNIVNK